MTEGDIGAPRDWTDVVAEPIDESRRPLQLEFGGYGYAVRVIQGFCDQGGDSGRLKFYIGIEDQIVFAASG
ncbi:unnamed protein product, partial [marine sediment metagenome]